MKKTLIDVLGKDLKIEMSDFNKVNDETYAFDLV